MATPINLLARISKVYQPAVIPAVTYMSARILGSDNPGIFASDDMVGTVNLPPLLSTTAATDYPVGTVVYLNLSLSP